MAKSLDSQTYNKRNKVKLFGLVTVATLSLSIFANSQHVQADTISTTPVIVGDWSGLQTANQGGNNVAFVDYESLSSNEISQIRQLDNLESAKGCSLYKFVYVKDRTTTPFTITSNKQIPGVTKEQQKVVRHVISKELPQTGVTQMEAYGSSVLVFWQE